MIDQNHPDYLIFRAEFEQLGREMKKEIDSLPSEELHGQDGPSGAIHRRYEQKLKELQIKYQHLYHN